MFQNFVCSKKKKGSLITSQPRSVLVDPYSSDTDMPPKKVSFCFPFPLFFVCSLKKKEPVTLHSKNQNETVMKEGGNEFLFELRQQKTGSLQELVRVRLLFFFRFFFTSSKPRPLNLFGRFLLFLLCHLSAVSSKGRSFFINSTQTRNEKK